MLGGIVGVITAVAKIVAGPIARWQELKVVKHAAEVKRLTQGDEAATELDRLSIQQRGWKDDYLLLITTAPLVLVFVGPLFGIEGLEEAVQQGFAALAAMPEYYWYALAIIYIDTFGFRRMLRVAVEHWLESKFGGGGGASVGIAGAKQRLIKRCTKEKDDDFDFPDGN